LKEGSHEEAHPEIARKAPGAISLMAHGGFLLYPKRIGSEAGPVLQVERPQHRRMKMKKAPVFFLVAVCAFLITTADLGISAERLIVRVTGADSMFGRLHTLSQLFEKENPTIDVKVIKGETVDAGFAALIG